MICPTVARRLCLLEVEAEAVTAAEVDPAAAERSRPKLWEEGCQMAKFDPFLSLDCARVEGGGDRPCPCYCESQLAPTFAQLFHCHCVLYYGSLFVLRVLVSLVLS